MPPLTPRPSDEFPPGAAEWDPALDRRRFLQLMGASLALAGGAACTRQPLERIVPYIHQPENLIPGRPQFYATGLTLGGYARGVLVESHEGRPTKIEGNPQHPASLGATEPWMQAAILDLYDPDRSKTVTHQGKISTWDAFFGALNLKAETWRVNQGAGLRILSRHETSPTFIAQIQRLRDKYPMARVHTYEPVPPPQFRYHLGEADVILSLDADFLTCGPECLRYQREFSQRRRSAPQNRLYVMESSPTLTGAAADHRLSVSPGELLGEIPGPILADLRAHAGRSVVIAGEHSSALMSKAAELNHQLGSFGRTVERVPKSAWEGEPLADLVRSMRAGEVETLLVMGANPVYDAPADFEFASLLSLVRFTAHLGLHTNETAALCAWHLPENHSLESWSDARGLDQSETIIQPLIEPLYATGSRHSVLAALLGEAQLDDYTAVTARWQDAKALRALLHDGVRPGAPPPVTGAEPPWVAPEPAREEKAAELARGLHLLIRPHLYLHDGRFANNAWLQELPQPFTKLVWGNAAFIASATAARLAVAHGQVVELRFRGRTVEAPLFVLAGQAEDCVTVHLGYGRWGAGRVGSGVGFNAYTLRTSDALCGGAGLEIVAMGKSHTFVTTQHHFSMEGRDLARSAENGAVKKDDEPAPGETLYPPVKRNGPAWGMVIDLTTCTGCSACVIACQAENNIPVVGPEQVARGREMHWIRVDQYTEDGRTIHQPVPCMHCENAPCEVVCPTAATVHSSEGLNQMVYNRCIGTRYCSNNCPYKVRRFNFLAYVDESPSLRLQRNPDVSVRTRGVMEKCTYCVQRIQAVKIEAEKANREIVDGEITPACAQACPAEAIVFGNQNDPQSRVAKLKASPLNYSLLGELNTRPRTTYLAQMRNPNPALA